MTVVIPRPRDLAVTPRKPVSAAAALRVQARRGIGALYKPRTPIYPKLAHGRWRSIKWAMLFLTLGVYYITPWIRWSRPEGLPQQAVLVDFTGRRFYFFFIQLWPQEVYFITGLLVLAALTLFLTTALFGRLWCGYACPQTIWTDLFIAVERLFEGDRNARIKLDAAPLSFDKAWRKGGKHLTWLTIAAATGGAWVFYFHDAPALWGNLWTGNGPLTAYVSILVLTSTTYLLAGTMREQVCTYLCPWPRIQGAMIDEHTLQVIYRRDRGEPRAPHKKAESWEGRGDCVDCNQCVVVCPMGIDIRDGSQLECINCGLCVDACDAIMTKLERPTGLISYDSIEAVDAREAKREVRYPFVRARTLYYAGALAFVGGLMLWGLLNRSPVVFDVLRDRNPTFVRLHDGAVRDGYTIKIANRTFQRRTYAIAVHGLSDYALKTPGAAPGRLLSVVVEPDQVRAVRVFVSAPAASLPGPSAPVTFTLSSGAIHAETKSTFLSGAANPS